MIVLSVDVGIRNLAFCKARITRAEQGHHHTIHEILAWDVLDLCPAAAACPCAEQGCKRKAALFRGGEQGEQQEQEQGVEGLCAAHARKRSRFAGPPLRLAGKNAEQLRAVCAAHAGFAEFQPPARGLRAAMAAHVCAQGGEWVPEKKTKKKKTAATVYLAGVRFAEHAQRLGLFDGTDELLIENQLGFLAARMKSMQDIVSCLAVFARVPHIHAVSAVKRPVACAPPAPAASAPAAAPAAASAPASAPAAASAPATKAAQKKRNMVRSVYVAHKSDSVDRCRAWLVGGGDAASAWRAQFEAAKKKDDLADALVQLLNKG